MLLPLLTLSLLSTPVVDAAPPPAPTESPAIGPVRRFALVIGSNDPPRPNTPRLAFADDDAARVDELLREAGVEVALVATFDRETQALHADALPDLATPTRSGLLAAHATLVSRMKAARAAGATVEYIVYFSGHGDVGADGQVFLSLSGSTRLTRSGLFAEILGGSPAHFNHLILDACNSEAMVLSRGPRGWQPDHGDAEYARAAQQYLDRLRLDRFPNTGVLLATSIDQKTHEWERYRGGIFTHELLSALRGSADINGDGRLEYSEVGAFVAAANSGVRDPRGRLRVIVRPPRGDERRPLLVHDDLAHQRLLVFDARDAHRYTIEDSRGLTLADLRRSGEHPGYLRLPAGEVFVFREGTGEAREEAHVAARASAALVSRLTFAPVTGRERGALDQALRGGLFAVPFGASYYRGYVDRTSLLAVRSGDWDQDTWQDVTANAARPSDPTSPPPPLPPPLPLPPPPAPWKDRFWGGISVGVVIDPRPRAADVRTDTRRFSADQTQGWAPPFRGLDIVYSGSQVRDTRFPRAAWFFRTGLSRAHIDFGPADAAGFTPGQAQRLDYLAVPLWLGGNLYLWPNRMIRPYAGAGLGLDVVRLEYRREQTENRIHTTAEVGLELHAGVELRINNYFVMSAAVRQQWTNHTRLTALPNLSTQGLGIILSVGAGFPIRAANDNDQRERQARLEARHARELQTARERAARAAAAWQLRPLEPAALPPRPAGPTATPTP